jgi:hypothetical protein
MRSVTILNNMDKKETLENPLVPEIIGNSSENIVHTTGSTSICFIKKGEFVARSIAGETIIVPVRGRMGDLDSIYNLNEVASFIWNQIDGQTDVGQLIQAVCDEFEVPPATATNDTQQFIAELQSAAMIEPKD